MKFGVRKPSIKRSISARTTGKLKRSVNKAVNPLYGKKGMGYINDPQKAVYNKVYNKTTVGVKDIIDSTNNSTKTANKSNQNNSINSVPGNANTENSGCGCFRYVFAIAFIILGLFTLPVGLIFIGIAIILLVCKKKSQDSNPSTNTSYASEQHIDFTDKTEDAPAFNVSVSTSTYQVERCLAKNFAIDQIDLGQFVGEAGSPIKWSKYEITGVKTSTNRKNKRYYDAINLKHIELLANIDGLTNIEIVSVTPHEPAYERQIEQAKEMGISIPDGITSNDLSAIIKRVKYSEDVVSEVSISSDTVRYYLKPTASPTVDFAKYAFEKGITFSAYISEYYLLCLVVGKFNMREKLAFYAYCVMCDQSNQRIGNMLNSPQYQFCLQFAKWAENLESVTRSLEGRDINDFLKPNKRTSAYRAVIDYLGSYKK